MPKKLQFPNPEGGKYMSSWELGLWELGIGNPEVLGPKPSNPECECRGLKTPAAHKGGSWGMSLGVEVHMYGKIPKP